MSEKEIKLYPLRKRIRGPPLPFKSPIKGIILYGHVPRLSGFLQRVRVRMGLPKTPPTAYEVKDAVKEIQRIIRSTGLDVKICWDWKQKRMKY